MKHHLNTLFITTEDACLTKQGEAVVVRVEQENKLHVPLNNIGGIVCFGRVLLTQPAIAKCAEQGVPISLLDRNGRFLARVTGPTSGNVLLRRQQYRCSDSLAAVEIARHVVIGKIANARAVLLRHLRDYPEPDGASNVAAAAERLSAQIKQARAVADLDALRGVEGDAGRTYFGVFDELIRAQRDAFRFTGRSRRPPLDNVNALLSFLYAMLAQDAVGACEAVGLDPAVGFLHRDRPGRPGLALDLIEELRPFLADRLALSLINRRQVTADGFTAMPGGAVQMSDKTRKAVLTAYQQRKQMVVTHPFLGERTTIGLIVHLQARLLARHLRGDEDAYPPFLWK